jgi:hypothetical protein
MGETRLGLCNILGKCLLLDEAQGSYLDDYLWSSLIKEISGTDGGLLIILATSYGSSRNQPAKPPLSTPPVLVTDQRLSLKWTTSSSGGSAGLYLDLAETNDVIRREMVRKAWSIPFADDLILWLHHMTSGHAGALSAMLQMAFENHV